MAEPEHPGPGPSGSVPRSLGDVEAVYVKIAKRIIPILGSLFILAWLDRVNVGFAKLQMVGDLSFSEAVYGFGAGIFFLGYFLFEIPSNLFLERIGARKTFARITILWGLTSIATMFVKTATWFYIMRFLLGAFEAGLIPGVLLYLTYWFPERRRAAMLACFQTAVPIAGIVGGPISGWIMGTMGGRIGLANWQWLFLLEGIPSIVMGFVTLAIVVDNPMQAPWLTDVEKQLVVSDLAADRSRAGVREHGFGEALKNPRLWLLTAIYFCLAGANPTLAFWGPTIIRSFGVKSNILIGLLSALPYIGAIFGIVLVGRHSDRTLERRWHTAVPCLSCAVAFVLIGALSNFPVLAFIALILATAAALSVYAPFWQMPTLLLVDTAAAGGIALINSIGNLSGWVGPYIVGWLQDRTGKTSMGLLVVAGLEVLAAILILLLMPHRSDATSSAALR